MWMLIVLFVAGLLAFLIYASYSIRAGIYLKSFCRKKTSEKIVALTFDDGPDKVRTPEILKVLDEYNVKACFFCIGKKIKGNETLLKDIMSRGHLVGNHSYTHSALLPCYSLKALKKDYLTCQFALEQVTLQPVRLFRPPFGVTNPTVAKAVQTLGYTSIGWDVRSLDTCIADKRRVMLRIKRRLKPGSVVLLHDRLPDCDVLLRLLLEYLKQENYRVVRIDRMLDKD